MPLFQNLPPEIATMIWAVLPVAEIRASIPVALEVYQMSVASAIFWSLVGNLATTALLVILIGPISKYLSEKSKFFKLIFDWVFERTRKKFYNKYSRYGDVALVLFVAVPLPTTGCWAGVAAAWLFGIKPKKAFVLISIGVLISAMIVTLITLGILKIV
ncbi:ligand-binding protein SH3 [Candidatus Kuenenbacteria bacterium CG_4_9_14_3_um_filter_39_14]|uniref:Ligand-binding protein SH3 n=6 Tax=Candidatus Kueneniibacteriota TaxID=1752740 RepID=A0A2M7IMP6_9BACT|nr:small multi-drug export protein [Candidatus Kuenenbacteria bacterium]OIP56666.1 MAG: hypothetical protein AUK13_00545 [Candidatus Kuenenbacteria bacterium CG2_30_39_24]PIP28780.1 MAG: ligand-binding protein SH3 [Candidatus Kuenenbacteria bacterium CG23_combo_of_CG06-09_8_20_14_all_39_39]PIR80567.1 MAG: ligand-binding protein SH3 [Candidatus Kuenenbacteria bacterium CG10_big_fil_rev_8_21_14_0_10_39_14]PIW96060.1 MAG: ligand-binding protein SH3 [Candidatus Kuenenbacteria bacterium CG_4_8_14_3_